MSVQPDNELTGPDEQSSGPSRASLFGVFRLRDFRLLVTGEGISLLGTWTIQHEIDSGALVTRPLRPALERPFAVLTARDRSVDPRADVLAEVLREWARSKKKKRSNARS